MVREEEVGASVRRETRTQGSVKVEGYQLSQGRSIVLLSRSKILFGREQEEFRVGGSGTLKDSNHWKSGTKADHSSSGDTGPVC